MYADYVFYTDTFMGSVISEVAFPRLALRAGEYVAYITYSCSHRAEGDALTAVKMAVCAVAEVIQSQENAQRDEKGNSMPGPIRSEKVAGHSIGYAVAATGRTETLRAKRAELYSAAQTYLAHTGLLYGGAAVL